MTSGDSIQRDGVQPCTGLSYFFLARMGKILLSTEFRLIIKLTKPCLESENILCSRDLSKLCHANLRE